MAEEDVPGLGDRARAGSKARRSAVLGVACVALGLGVVAGSPSPGSPLVLAVAAVWGVVGAVFLAWTVRQHQRARGEPRHASGTWRIRRRGAVLVQEATEALEEAVTPDVVAQDGVLPAYAHSGMLGGPASQLLTHDTGDNTPQVLVDPER